MEIILHCEICGKEVGTSNLPLDTPADVADALSHTGQRCDSPDCVDAPPLTEGGQAS